MDPVTLIATALAAGAALGAKDTASAAVTDAYASLKGLLKKRFAGMPAAELVLSEHENDPETWQAALEASLRAARAGEDDDLIAAARALVALADPEGARTGKYVVAAGDGAVAVGGNVGGDIITGSTVVKLDAPQPDQVAPEPPLHNLPAPAAVFTGREEEMSWLEAAAGGTGVRQVIYGLGGVGKSELALQHAHDHVGDQIVWRIAADSRAGIEEGLAKLAQRISPEIGLAPRANWGTEWAVSWLQHHTNWLLILDDVRKYSDIQDLLGELDKGRILITTRRDLGADIATRDGHASGSSRKLGTLTPLDAIKLLERESKRQAPGDEQVNAEIAGELGCLPLALKHAAAWIRKTNSGPREYLAELRAAPIQAYGQGAALAEATPSLVRTMQVSLSAIAGREAGADAIHVLVLLAYMAPDDVPRRIFADAGGTVATALGVLADYSMVDLSEQQVSIHRLVQNVVRHLDPSPGAALMAATGLLLRALPAADPADHLGDWPYWRSLMPHVRAVAGLAATGSRPADAGRLLNRALPFLRLERQDARTLAELARDILEQRLGRDTPETVTAWHNLAVAYRAQGELSRARRLLEETVSARAAMFGPDHPDTLDSQTALANAHAEAGHPEAAAEILRDVISRSARTRGPEHPDTLRARANLACAYQDHGDLRPAAALYSELLPLIGLVMGPGHPDTLTVRGNLAQVYEELGEFRHAVPVRQEILGLLSHLLGNQHPRTLGALRALSRARAGAGDTTAALAGASEAVADLGRVHGSRYPETLSAKMTLAFALAQDSRPAEAADLFRHVLEERITLLGPDHPDVIATRNSLAQALINAGDTGQAVTVSREAVAECERLLDPGHSHAVHARLMHGQALMVAGDFAGALPVIRQAARDAERVLDVPGRSFVFQCRMISIACETLLAAGQLIAAGDPQALPFLARAADDADYVLADAEQDLGPQHPDMAKLRGWAKMFRPPDGQ